MATSGGVRFEAILSTGLRLGGRQLIGTSEGQRLRSRRVCHGRRRSRSNHERR